MTAADHLAAADDILGELLRPEIGTLRRGHLTRKLLDALRLAWLEDFSDVLERAGREIDGETLGNGGSDVARDGSPSEPPAPANPDQAHFWINCFARNRSGLHFENGEGGFRQVPPEAVAEIARLARIGLHTERAARAEPKVDQFERLCDALRAGKDTDVFYRDGEYCCTVGGEGGGSGGTLADAVRRALDDGGFP